MTDSNPTSVIVQQIDQMVQDEDLTTRSGLRLIISVFREGMVILGDMDTRMKELENAYVRFTNTMSVAKDLEKDNNKKLQEIVPVFNLVKWVGMTLGGLIIILIWSLITGTASVSFGNTP